MDDTARASPPIAATSRPTVGVGIVILRRHLGTDQVVLIQRGKPPSVGQWSIPGGHQELGETTREAAFREAREETGLVVDNLRLIDVVDVVRRNADLSVHAHWTLVDFRADWIAGDPAAGDDATHAQWVALSDLDRYSLWDETLRVIRAAAAM